VGGDERLSKFEFARAIASEWGFDADLVSPRSIEEVAFAAERPRDSSMDVSRARSARVATPGAHDGIARMHALETRDTRVPDDAGRE